MVKYFLLALVIGLSGPLIMTLPVNWAGLAATVIPTMAWLLVFEFCLEAHGRRCVWLLLTLPLLFVAPIRFLMAFGEL